MTWTQIGRIFDHMEGGRPATQAENDLIAELIPLLNDLMEGAIAPSDFYDRTTPRMRGTANRFLMRQRPEHRDSLVKMNNMMEEVEMQRGLILRCKHGTLSIAEVMEAGGRFAYDMDGTMRVVFPEIDPERPRAKRRETVDIPF